MGFYIPIVVASIIALWLQWNAKLNEFLRSEGWLVILPLTVIAAAEIGYIFCDRMTLPNVVVADYTNRIWNTLSWNPLLQKLVDSFSLFGYPIDGVHGWKCSVTFRRRNFMQFWTRDGLWNCFKFISVANAIDERTWLYSAISASVVDLHMYGARKNFCLDRSFDRFKLPSLVDNSSFGFTSGKRNGKFHGPSYSPCGCLGILRVLSIGSSIRYFTSGLRTNPYLEKMWMDGRWRIYSRIRLLLEW